MNEMNNQSKKQDETGLNNISGNMYSYRDDNNNNNQNATVGEAIRRSIQEGNPNIDRNQNNYATGYEQNNNINGFQQQVNISEKNSLYWVTFLIIGFFEVIILIALAILFEKKITFIGVSSPPEHDKYDYDLLRDMNVMIFIGFGMLHSLLRRNTWTSITINTLMIAISVQLGLFFNFIWERAFTEKWDNQELRFDFIIEAVFISSSVLVTFGCVLGKLSIIQYIIMTIFETIICSLNYKLCAVKLRALDHGGALYIHTFGTIFGLSITIVLFCSSKVKNSFRNFDYYNKTSYFSNKTSFLGMLFLFCFFPSFNSALCLKDNIREKGRINTYFSLFGSVMSSFITSALLNGGRFIFEQILFGSISGAIIISGCCTVCLDHWASIIIGTLGGVICVILLSKVKPYFVNWGLQDICNVIIIHGISGLLGGFITPMFISGFDYRFEKAKKEGSEHEDNEDYNSYLGLINQSINQNFQAQAGIQIGALFISIAISFIGGIATGYIMKISHCGKINQYFIDAEFFKEEEKDIFKYIEPNIAYSVDINNPSLFPKKMDFSSYNNHDIRGIGNQQSYY